MAAPGPAGDRQIKVVDVGDVNVAVGVLQVGRIPASDAPPRGISHAQVTEVYYILSGSGTLVTGGSLADTTTLDPESEVVQVAVGPSVMGTFEGGERRKVAAGDVVVIPAGVPHGWAEVPDHIHYLSVRPDADRVLPAGYVNPALEP